MLLLLYGPRNSGKKCIINHLVNSEDFNKLDYSDSIYETLVKLGKWKSNYITILPSIKDWDLYKKRPCARLVVLFAPSNSNWRTENDDLFYSQILKYEEAYKIPNFGTLQELYSSLDACLTKIRPSWDMYFINLAINVSLRSNCMKGRVGCVIVKDNHVISTGYNGTPFNLPNCYENGCTRCNMGMRCGVGLDYCLCVHAEENALLFLGKERAKGSVLYVTRFPCQLCCRKIVQMELREVVFMTEYGISDGSVVKIFESANINVRHVQI